jgi:hypothetical protein
LLLLHGGDSADDGANVFIEGAQPVHEPVELVVDALDHLQLPLPRVIASEARPLHALHVLAEKLHGELSADVECLLALLRGFEPDGDELLHFVEDHGAGRRVAVVVSVPLDEFVVVRRLGLVLGS